MSKVVKFSSVRENSYAFVLPRYFEGIAGGAEVLASALAKKLAERGDKVEILTTCAKDNRTFEDFFPAEKSEQGGLLVSRFPVDKRDLDIWIPKQIAISQNMKLSVEDQLEWMVHGVNSQALYKDLLNREQEFDAIFFGPYLFATTFWGSLMVRERAVLIPCLHNECYAYQEVIASMFRQVRGALFNAEAEKRLATSLYGKIPGDEVGMGFERVTESEHQSLTPYFKEKFPYLLYLGRKETGKNVQLLIDYFIETKNSSRIKKDLKLVILGGGDFSDLHRPEALGRDDIIDLAHLSELDKRRVLRHANVLCQPSVNESFSIVLMEAWLLGVPVLVHNACPVTKEHVVASGGGLFFNDNREFIETVQRLTTDCALSLAMGQAGLDYVLTKYSWSATMSRFDRAMRGIFGATRDEGSRDSEKDSSAS